MAKTEVNVRLYRILDFTKVVQIFEKKELYFANPEVWDDPYEKFIRHSKNNSIFAQCWSNTPISDAMWRIYSQNGMGVRISTTKAKLESVLKGSAKRSKYRYRVAEVEYLSRDDFAAETKKLAEDLNESFNISRAVDALYMKREAFDHEDEWRATLYSISEDIDQNKKGFTVPVDPHDFIDRILLDPRAPDELVQAFKFFIQQRLKYKGSVQRSALYRSPEQIKIDEIFLDQL